MRRHWPWLVLGLSVITLGLAAVIAWNKFGPRESDYDIALKTGQVVELEPLRIVVPQGVTHKKQHQTLFIYDKDQSGAKPGKPKGKEIEFDRLYIECKEPVTVFVNNPTDRQMTLVIFEQVEVPEREWTEKEQKEWEAAKTKWDKQEALRVAFRKAFRGTDEQPLPYPSRLKLRAVSQEPQGEVDIAPNQIGTLTLERKRADSLSEVSLGLKRPGLD
jgi:hypothetical protein